MNCRRNTLPTRLVFAGKRVRQVVKRGASFAIHQFDKVELVKITTRKVPARNTKS